MFDDERPEEPDEPYPGPDPEAGAEELGPGAPSPPDPPTPGESLPTEADVPGELLQSFWALVLLANAALLGLTIGPVALYVGRRRIGAGLLAVGAFAALAGARRYRQVQRERDREREREPAREGDRDRDRRRG